MAKVKKKKVFIVKGDVVQFVLNPTATFTAGNYFEGTVIALVPKEFSVRIVPSARAKKKLSAFMDSFGLITVGFRCARIKSLKAHKALLVARAKKRADDKLKRDTAKLERLRDEMTTSNDRTAGKKKKKKKPKWVYKPS